MGRSVPNVFLLSKAAGPMVVSLIQPSLQDVHTKKMLPRTKVRGYYRRVPSAFVRHSMRRRGGELTTADRPGRSFRLDSKIRKVPEGRAETFLNPSPVCQRLHRCRRGRADPAIAQFDLMIATAQSRSSPFV
jgi:hypothetical protein